MAAFTIPYFSLTKQPPAADRAPHSTSGVFSSDAVNGKHIREEKFSVSWSGGRGTGMASLMVVLNPLSQYIDRTLMLRMDELRPYKPPGINWVRNNLFCIVHHWGEVLDELDTQTTLPSSITFNNEVRQGILFEDRNFTNSKRYFWALQSLRLFAEHIEGTLRALPCVLYCARDFDGGSPWHYKAREDFTNEFQEKFGKLRERIERERQEVQSLSDGVSGLDLLPSGVFAYADKKGYSSFQLLPWQRVDWRRNKMVTFVY
ncbi:MAG: hypothetical protein Q9224_007376 [Gallowayella concinna]